VSELFANYFETVVGLTTEEPNPFTALQIRELVSPQEILYVGDSGIDMQTATNVLVLWGYRPKEELLADGAIHIINSPLDLITLL
jgi:phosphoglycolate phosphatase